MAKKNYYSILGVPQDASTEDIKKAYRKQALRYHPDHNRADPEAEEKFKEASEAYSVLGNPEKRRIYDQFGIDGLRDSGRYGGAGNFDFFSDSIFADFGDILGDLFGFGSMFSGSRHRRGGGPRQGKDLGLEVELSLEESFLGVEREIELERDVNCLSCDGSGSQPDQKPETCRQCGGSGSVRQSQGFFSIATTCPICRGSGQVVTHPCQSCRGTGRRHEKKILKVNFPAGIESGNRLRVSGEGGAGINGGRSGDLYLLIRIRQRHPRFHREGNDLLTELAIGFAQAALGGEATLKTFEGIETIKIPAGSQSGQVIKIKNRGFKSINRWGRGDLLVQLRVKTPVKLSAREKKLLLELGEIEKTKEHNLSDGHQEKLIH